MLKEILAVHDHPNLIPDDNFGAKVLRLIKLYGLILLALIPVVLLLTMVNKYVTDVLHHPSLMKANKHRFSQVFKVLGKPGAALLVCVIGPLFEELIFRLWLNFKKRQIAMSVFIAVFYLSLSVMARMIMVERALSAMLLAAVALILVLIGCRYLIADATAQITDHNKHVWISCSIILFALVHISNYRPLDLSILWVYPIFVIPQLIIGWCITYLRLKNGFGWGVALHILFNTVSVMFVLFARQL